MGYKNSGKTTLLERWIGIVKSQCMTVSVLKHHGHGGGIELSSENTDTSRFFKKSADATLVAGGGQAQLLLNDEPPFKTLKELASGNSPDVLLIEGYKSEPGKKVILVRSEDDWETLKELDGIQLVIGKIACNDWPVIENRSDAIQLDRWFADWLKEEEHNETI
ncbi:molybdopterin-guanine dinucleotide biosynthesis protein B [Sporosarcina aquimarina]|uniref:molybdopterin-guanine dinucleotide biosynthesis protein B n=1 Tax=Sporosarcina aquimarina TaxID=114975 RepID=UPI00295F121A|nr:molybdopterin-guanine dinucleotide biosynthesis protein B [Sporosarcina aquimarina]